jgi:hypothetical protein
MSPSRGRLSVSGMFWYSLEGKVKDSPVVESSVASAPSYHAMSVCCLSPSTSWILFCPIKFVVFNLQNRDRDN